MEAVSKNCQNCRNQFTIEPEDFEFYKKIDVPAPTFCPQCRMQRRLSIRNERSLYKRICGLCNKETLSIYSPEKDLCIYCPECYRSDNWDPFSYGRDYDFSKPLFEQLDRLFREVPRPAVNETNLVNCSYCEDCVDCKNLYLVFGGFHCEDIMYSYSPIFSKNSMDVSLVNHSEKTYEASNSFGLYNTRFAYHAEECLDSAFLFDSVGCSDCFGCVNLRNKKYYIFNKPYSKQEYAEEIKRWDLGSYEILEEAKKKFWNLCRSTPRRCAIIKRSVNSTGHIVTDSKNCHHCFSVFAGAENLKYVYMAGMAFKDSYDAWGAGAKSQLLYEVTGCMGGERVFFTNNTHYCSNTQYSNKCFHSHNIFGCVGIKKKNYCIFNKQYSKEEYASLVKKIVEQAKAVPYVDAKGRVYRYGEFFPIETMPVAYNESIAYERYPLSREQALAAGYPWYDEAPRKYAVTVSAADLPDHIRDVQDGITQQVIGCAHASSCADKCIGAFKITQRELEFYRQQVLALPRLCPNCRHGERERKRAGIKLFSGTCQCVGKCSADGAYQNHTTHVHGESGCGARFETPYVAGGGEIVYCEVCYQNETI